MSVDFHFTTWKLGFLNISEYLARYGIQMDPSVNERRWQSGKKPVLCMLGLLSTIIRGREPSDQESVIHEKIALAHEHNWAPITSTSAREVARTSARRPGHPARGVSFLNFLVCLLPLALYSIYSVQWLLSWLSRIYFGGDRRYKSRAGRFSKSQMCIQLTSSVQALFG